MEYKSRVLKTKYKLTPKQREYYRNRKALQKANGTLKKYPKVKQASKEYHNNYWRKMRELIIENYGGECECCKEKTFEFMSIDHVDGGGIAHRKEVKNIAQWLIKNNFPPGFRILCHNCNMAIGVYKYCPHFLKKLTK